MRGVKNVEETPKRCQVTVVASPSASEGAYALIFISSDAKFQENVNIAVLAKSFLPRTLCAKKKQTETATSLLPPFFLNHTAFPRVSYE